jgi:hypothetical protein
MKMILKLKKPVCRIPIKPGMRHKIETKYQRKSKHPLKDKNDN